jgi:hypothetical protein
VQVLVTDIDGQATLTPPAALLVAGQPPSVMIARGFGGRGVSVRVSDRYAGVEARRVKVSFGDGSHARGRARFSHRYGHAGIYRVVVEVSDKIGNRGVTRQLVSVR